MITKTFFPSPLGEGVGGEVKIQIEPIGNKWPPNNITINSGYSKGSKAFNRYED
jgi:hypothetical protein